MIDKLIKIATDEVGYIEKNSLADLDSKVKNPRRKERNEHYDHKQRCREPFHGEVFHISRERDDIVSATADVADRNIVGFILCCVSRAV